VSVRMRELWRRMGEAIRWPWRPRFPERPSPAVGEFVEAAFANAAGTRPYRLYRPASAPAGRTPMLVMLHGCKQDPLDFATGTRMNAWAEALGWRVLYPGQTKAANPWRCWNWFRRVNQQAGR
jgi:poly(3-hydroxybutyrate) depolymerase